MRANAYELVGAKLGRFRDFTNPQKAYINAIISEQQAEEISRLSNPPINIKEYVFENGDKQITINIKINLTSKWAPAVYRQINDGVPEQLTADTLCKLDGEEISDVDIVFQPGEWSHSGRSGYAAYCVTALFHIRTDKLRSSIMDRIAAAENAMNGGMDVPFN
jgi:hypothetical protein